MGYQVVRVSLTRGGRPTLQIMAERNEGTMTVEDCATISHAVSALLDVADRSGRLSPRDQLAGDRPATGAAGRLRAFCRLRGQDRIAALDRWPQALSRQAFSASRAITVKLMMGADAVALPLSSIAHAKLVLTDALLAATEPHNRS